MKIIKESKVITEAPVDVDLHNAAIRYAKKTNKPVIYGYSKRDNKFYPLTPRVYNGDDKDFRKKYKAQSIYVAYPDKLEVEIEGRGNKERKKIEVLPESKKINEAKSLEDKVADELEKVGLTAYAGGAYLGHMVQIETEEEKNKAKKVADKFGLGTKEIPHKTYTDFYILIPEEEEKKPVTKKRKTRKKVANKPVKESLNKKRINESIDDKKLSGLVWDRLTYTDGEFYKLLKDLSERALDTLEDSEEKDDEAIKDAVWNALDEGMIYTDDEWTAYRMYCEMGDNPDIMWEGLFNDVYSIVNHMVEDTEEIEESCKKPVKESVLSEKGKQALKKNLKENKLTNKKSKKLNERMITVKIDENDLLDELMNRVYVWTKDNDLVYDLFEEMYQNLIDVYAFDGQEIDIMKIVDNDYNNCRVVEKDEDDYEGILETYKNGESETKDGFFIEAAKEDNNGDLVFLVR